MATQKRSGKNRNADQTAYFSQSVTELSKTCPPLNNCLGGKKRQNVYRRRSISQPLREIPERGGRCSIEKESCDFDHIEAASTILFKTQQL